MHRPMFFVVALVCLIATAASAAVPTFITLQGRLTDSIGAPLPAGSKTFTFRIFNTSGGGSQLWPAVGGEVQSINSDADGLWVALVGSASSLTDPVFSGFSRWLEIDVDGTTLPRTRIATSPTAFRVSTVDGASGGTISGDLNLTILNVGTKLTVGPGNTNTGLNSLVVGESNTASGDYSSVGGGQSNMASGLNSVVGGGHSDTAGGIYAMVGGGELNGASSQHCVVSGGLNNKASGPFSTISGGQDNTASAHTAAVIGGVGNTASGQSATVGGGFNNLAEGDISFAAGLNARAIHGGSFVWGDFSTSDPLSTTAPNQFLVRAAGGVGIGTNAPSDPLHVVGNIRATGCVIGSNIVCPSDVRFKRDVQTIDHALAAVEKLRGVRYEWKCSEFPDREFAEGEQIGLVAQEVRDIVPQAVIEQSDGYLAVDYARLVPLLIEGMKEQQKRIEALERKLDQRAP